MNKIVFKDVTNDEVSFAYEVNGDTTKIVISLKDTDEGIVINDFDEDIYIFEFSLEVFLGI